MSAPARVDIDGRPHLSRAAVAELAGKSPVTVAGWYRMRAMNGFPAGAFVGRTHYVPESEVRSWLDSGPPAAAGDADAAAGSPPTPVILAAVPAEGDHVTRRDIAERTSYAVSYLRNLYHERDVNGHPPAAFRVGVTDYWRWPEIEQFLDEYAAAKQASLTPLDMSGHADDLIDTAEVARVLGYRDSKSISGYRSPARNAGGYFPTPVGLIDGRPRWRRGDIWDFGSRRSRPGRAGLPAEQLNVGHRRRAPSSPTSS